MRRDEETAETVSKQLTWRNLHKQTLLQIEQTTQYSYVQRLQCLLEDRLAFTDKRETSLVDGIGRLLLGACASTYEILLERQSTGPARSTKRMPNQIWYKKWYYWTQIGVEALQIRIVCETYFLKYPPPRKLCPLVLVLSILPRFQPYFNYITELFVLNTTIWYPTMSK